MSEAERLRLGGNPIPVYWADAARAGVAKLVDATDLNDWVLARETADAELLKFGEPCQMAIPSQARAPRGKV